MNDHYERIINLFRGPLAMRRPGRWAAYCPVHKSGQEKKRSVFLWINERRHLMGKCYACGCRLPQMLTALGQDWNDGHFLNGHGAAQGKTMRRITAYYVYHDANGAPLYRVVRGEPKAFHVEHLLSDGTWRNGLGPCQPVLYRLPELLTSGRPIVVVEGEKDVETIRGRLGVIATTNLGGAGRGWRDGYSETLADRRVIVIPDNDDAGRRHAHQIVGSLIAHRASAVGLVTLPEWCKDVTDYFDRGGDGVELARALKNAVFWTPTRPSPKEETHVRKK